MGCENSKVKDIKDAKKKDAQEEAKKLENEKKKEDEKKEQEKKKKEEHQKELKKKSEEAKKLDNEFIVKNKVGERTLGKREKQIIDEGVEEESLKKLHAHSDKILFMYLRLGSKKKYEEHLIQRQKDLAEIRDNFNAEDDPDAIWNGYGKFFRKLIFTSVLIFDLGLCFLSFAEFSRQEEV